jgi:hypothetical protein
MRRLAKWWFLSQTVLGVAWGGWLGVSLATLPHACRTALYGARSGSDLLASLQGCHEARAIVSILELVL